MIWFLLSVLTALAVATQDAWVKKYLSSRSVYDMAAYPMVFSLPLLVAVFPLVPVPPLDRWFLMSVAVGIPLNAVCFFMNIEIGNWSPLSPVKAIWQEAGSRLMMTVAFLFSFSAVIGKAGILHSSPLFFSVSFFLTFNLVLVVFLAGLKKIRVRGMWRRRRVGAIAGLLFFLHIIFHGLAIAMTKAAYMIAVKRLSVLISVVYGGMFFQETNLVLRFCGSALMVGGVLMILLMGA